MVCRKSKKKPVSAFVKLTAGEDDDSALEEENKRVEATAQSLRKALGASAERQPELFWKAI